MKKINNDFRVSLFLLRHTSYSTYACSHICLHTIHWPNSKSYKFESQWKDFRGINEFSSPTTFSSYQNNI